MERDVYERLAKHLDELPGGFPRTEKGVEMKLLKRLFTPEEAELAMHLTLMPEPPRVVARRAGVPTAEIAERLDKMSRKGLVMCMEPEGGGALEYAAAQFVIGIWEFNVNNLDEDFVRDMDEYIPNLFDPEVLKKSPQLRTIPISQAVPLGQTVMPYDRAEEIVRSQEKFLVAPCICRREQSIIGKGCDAPKDSCLIFGFAADYYHHNGIGRWSDRAEVLDLLKMAEEKALVLQPGNSQNPINICLCCGCCCGVLRNVKQHSKPAMLTGSGYQAKVDKEACVGCGTCSDRCQMEAISVDNGTASLDSDRCIGCGLCVTTCTSGAVSLIKKPDAERPKVPKDHVKAAIHLGQTRGRLGPMKLGQMMLKSKWDRLVSRA